MLKFMKLLVNIFLIILVLENCNMSSEKDEKKILGVKERDLSKLLILNSYMSPSDGVGTSARFENIQDIALDPNNNYIFVADGSYSGRLRRVSLPSGMVTTLLNSSYISNGSLLFVSSSNVVYTSNRKECRYAVQFTNYSGWRETSLNIKFTVTVQ